VEEDVVDVGMMEVMMIDFDALICLYICWLQIRRSLSLFVLEEEER
jgi:hypothetical protein